MEPDPVQDDVVTGIFDNSFDPQAIPIVTFCGWVKFTEGASTFRVYTDAWFGHWYEIPKDALVHQIKGSQSLTEGRRSHVWVRADAAVTKCESSTAVVFAQSDAAGDPGDPAGAYGGGGGTHKP
jgi:hypothetical protein